MKLITSRDVIESVFSRYSKQYSSWDPNKRFWDGRRVGDVLGGLARLDPETTTKGDLENLGLGSSWCSLTCDECFREVNAVMEFGENDYKETQVCRECLLKAAGEIDAIGKTASNV